LSIDSGKSSLIAALLRMIDLTAGEITIDGVDISTLSSNAVRMGLIVLPQSPTFIIGTVRQNISLTTSPSDDEIHNALEKVGLWSVITGLGGLDIEMKPAEMLSHGQQQLFCLARAMLQKGSIIVMDEPSSK
jgi:ATP-binding cassette, subfamily C (CFTR/MRP), member 1